MHSTRQRIFKRTPGLLAILLVVVGSALCAADERETLGEALFADANLSLNRNQSCSSCHDPDVAFSDGRSTVRCKPGT
jgi:cytochrome c peroxidase